MAMSALPVTPECLSPQPTPYPLYRTTSKATPRGCRQGRVWPIDAPGMQACHALCRTATDSHAACCAWPCCDGTADWSPVSSS